MNDLRIIPALVWSIDAMFILTCNEHVLPYFRLLHVNQLFTSAMESAIKVVNHRITCGSKLGWRWFPQMPQFHFQINDLLQSSLMVFEIDTKRFSDLLNFYASGRLPSTRQASSRGHSLHFSCSHPQHPPNYFHQSVTKKVSKGHSVKWRQNPLMVPWSVYSRTLLLIYLQTSYTSLMRWSASCAVLLVSLCMILQPSCGVGRQQHEHSHNTMKTSSPTQYPLYCLY